MDYLLAACTAYEKLPKSEKILYLTDNGENEVARALEWIEEIKEKEKNL